MEYTRNHYVPQWYQRRFLPESLHEKKFFYLDLFPEKIRLPKGKVIPRKSLLRWGPNKCFVEDDLYTARLGAWQSNEIEKIFFGKIDSTAEPSLNFFENFKHPSVDKKSFETLCLYMSIQKLRTPKGLAYLEKLIGLSDKNAVLIGMQKLQHLHCAIWTESVWVIADASTTKTKFLLSDHPVTVYNMGCFPKSEYCKNDQDPEIWLNGTHTIFPLSLNKTIILTNLSWARNPYGNSVKHRPNPEPFRPAMFNFLDIQTNRNLTENDVQKINFIIKSRAKRYIAAAEEEWLFPEHQLGKPHWDNFGKELLLMPDPRSMVFSGEYIIGYDNKKADAFDEYGRRPWQKDYKENKLHEDEWNSFMAFQGEYARKFGPARRGLTCTFSKIDKEADSPNFHENLLKQEHKYKSLLKRKKKS